MNAVDNFHEGQRVAIEEGDNDIALIFFRNALEATNQVEVNNEDYEDWQTYIKGTISYFKKNLPELEKFHMQVVDPKNKSVLERLLLGLKARGNIDYGKDYPPNNK